MSDYRAPVQDMEFVMKELVNLDQLAAMDRFSHVEPDQIAGLLDEAGRFFSEVIAPTNRIGDQQGSVRLDDASVKNPDGFDTAYQKLVESGWCAVPFEPEFGGGGFPLLIGTAIQEMLTSGNMALSLCPLLTQGAIHLLETHASSEQKAAYLPKMISGEWSGTMNLTEPHAGSDVGALTSKAERNEDGTYSITGQKIFITWGEHGLTENIIHLVLARTADAKPGTRGISVFIVPKYLLNDVGSIGEHNSLECVSLEHKLGIHASPTAVMAFEGATGYLIGEEQTGMASMFTMMNSARLAVGVEGVAVSERAYQDALLYSQERMQGGRPDREKGAQVPIMEHPDVRRMLITMKANIEAMRALCFLNAREMDLANASADADDRAKANERAELLTPLSKAWSTDLGNEMTSLAVQVYGGMGFIEESGVAQHYRDIRIAAIYEGTNGIQALDLIGRKLPMRGGAVMMELLEEITADAAGLNNGLSALQKPLLEAVAAVKDTSMWIAGNVGDDAMAGATPYLRLVATTVGGWLMAKSAVAAQKAIDAGATGDDLAFYEAKIITASFFLSQLLPAQMGLTASITAGADQLMSWTP